MDRATKVVITIAVLIIAFFIVASILSNAYTNKIYNDGTCLKCGGRYILDQVLENSSYNPTSHTWHHYNTYLYRCDNCGSVVELSDIRN